VWKLQLQLQKRFLFKKIKTLFKGAKIKKYTWNYKLILLNYIKIAILLIKMVIKYFETRIRIIKYAMQ